MPALYTDRGRDVSQLFKSGNSAHREDFECYGDVSPTEKAVG